MRNFILSILCCVSLQISYAQEIAFRLAVYDKINHEDITDAEVKLQDLNSLREYKKISNDTGYVFLSLAPAERYRLEVNTKNDGTGTGYLSYTYMLSKKDVLSKKTFDVELEKVKRSDSGLLPAMHFDYNIVQLNAENKKSLDDLLMMMKNFPSLKIEIGIYADCREDSSLLSKREAVIISYVNEKTESKNVVVKKYGNIRALNQCDCSSKFFTCSEEKYTENRRAEFKVISF